MSITLYLAGHGCQARTATNAARLERSGSLTGTHSLVAEYYEGAGHSRARFSWERIGDPSAPTATVPPDEEAAPE